MSKSIAYINHIALVLDDSASMKRLKGTVIDVADALMGELATQSKRLDQETRVTVYTFGDPGRIACLHYDKDVLRLPSVKSGYTASQGSTALIDGTMKAIEDLEKTPELYGEHAFLTYVLTDGQENSSRAHRPDGLRFKLSKLPEHWTMACFVPDETGRRYAEGVGFHRENVAIWNATSTKGVEDVGATIRQTAARFMQGRASGIRGYRNLFNMDTSALTPSTVKNNLTRLHFGQYRLYDVPRDTRIDAFVEGQTGRPYRLGEAYYQLMVPVKVQPNKQIAIYDKKDRAVYTGREARQILGLPDYEVRVSPSAHPNYDLYIQSTSVNRKLLGGQRVMVLS